VPALATPIFSPSRPSATFNRPTSFSTTI
jgi:hypothetical protein